MKPQIDESTYQEERRLVSLDREWSRQFIQPNGWTVIPADAKRPAEIAAVDNEMRGRVEQYELLTELPERISAYIGSDGRSVTVWTGLPLGSAYCSGRIGRGPLFGYYATISGRQYYGRGQGSGMFINLRETAESRRKRESI
jgi:hypothetical protein